MTGPGARAGATRARLREPGRLCDARGMHEDPAIAALEARVSACFGDRGLLKDPGHREAVVQTIALLDRGALRVASQAEAGGPWTVHALSLIHI